MKDHKIRLKRLEEKAIIIQQKKAPLQGFIFNLGITRKEIADKIGIGLNELNAWKIFNYRNQVCAWSPGATIDDFVLERHRRKLSKEEGK